jgi:hypothetical protein
MKSTFLLLVILGALTTTQVFAQTKKIKQPVKKPVEATEKAKTVTTTTAVSAPTAEAPKSSFDKFYERLSIGYFGVLTTPNFEKWDSRNAAISPEFSGGTNDDSYAMNIWSQVNFGYNYGGMMKFNVIPRFTTFLNEAPDQSAGERGMVILEDALIGFSGVVASSADKKFNWWIRPGVRLPTSHASRHFDNADFGRLTYGLEFLHSLTYDFTKEFQAGLTFQHRMWVFENRFNGSRIRHLTSPFVSYALNDTTKVQVYYEHMLENNKRWKSINNKNPVYKDVWQNAYIGVAKDVTSKINLFPYISAFVNDVPFSMQSVWAGMWITYSIK